MAIDLSFSKEALKENQKDMVTKCEVWGRGQWSPGCLWLEHMSRLCHL